MKVVIQRVTEASVSIEGELFSTIGKGLLVFIGIDASDDEKDLEYVVRKTSELRIFSDLQGKMNLSVRSICGEILLVSQFTLMANTQKGNRPSFESAAKPDHALFLYEKAIKLFGEVMGNNAVKTGKFGADMKISILNDGPVTIIIDSKQL